MMEWGWRGRLGRERAAGGCSVPLTPHLTSPLKGGRDELGKEAGWGRRGDGRKRRNDGVWEGESLREMKGSLDTPYHAPNGERDCR